ncbi:MAG: DUF302 domain-containing protein [Micromonosporaceae bacterium]
MEYTRSVTLDLPYAEAVPRVREAFREQGFGTLTEIDVRATLREKIGAEIEDYVILGTCNPHLAHRALQIDRRIGALLPCTVVVRALSDGRTLVQALDPDVMARVTELPELKPVAEEAGARVRAALASLAGE